jgi:tetratricopeptide (TPR) repeat protein
VLDVTEASSPIFTLLRNLVINGERRAFKMAWFRALRAGSGLSLSARLHALRAEVELTRGNHHGLMRSAGALIDRCKSPQGHFYRAQSLFLRGDYDGCVSSLRHFRQLNSRYPDAAYLLAEALVLIGDRKSAWKALEEVGRVSKRLKTWLVMTHLVRDAADYARLLANWRQAREAGLVPGFHKDVNEYLASGALRCGDYEAARQIWRETLHGVAKGKGGFAAAKPGRVNYSSDRAEIALADLKRVLVAAGIPMFLVSGTLLGCIREGRHLGHDKDIDVGIWDDVPRELLLSTLRTSGLFYVLASRSPEIVRVKHVNGIAIDVFYHFREGKSYWHGGVKVRWHNRPFSLVEHAFLGETYLIPADYDTYLTENYGDWRTPMKDFDSAYDTPNAEVLNANELAIHAFKMLLGKLFKGDADKVELYLRRLEELGEVPFVEDFKNKISR